jgi:hypothetical protein
MNVFISTKKAAKIINLTVLAAGIICSSSVAVAKSKHHKHHQPPVQQVIVYKDIAPIVPVSTFVRNWYVGGHIGESITHDNRAPASSDSVTQIGPGWTVDLGYQFAEFRRAIFAGELGYTQYHNSNETTPGINVASTEHFASYLAAVVQYPLINNFNILGKLGIAYSYAKKVFTTSGVSASANAYSPYYGAGFSYNVTPNAALVLQWARVRGNSKTGSTDLASLGITYNLI